MRYLKRRRRVIGKDVDLHQEDPLSGVANLFDVGIVFIVGLIGALISASSLPDVLSLKSEITLVRKNDACQVEIVTKKGKQVKVEKVTDKKLQGEGTRLGTAYRLKDGKVIYVPEGHEESH
ncbi:MAG: DUF2149 domain-containing protein [Planctomycetes bacterium]|nr:DUF2149 domain-containing protein [Planctomycetota bacterium]